jgi:putative ABC transport system permease protein
MFLIGYLWGELRGRFRQTLSVGSGLALGIGTVITISALASGVAASEAKVLQSLYGVGTDITVTTPFKSSGFKGGITPSAHTQVSDVLSNLTSGKIESSKVQGVAALKGVRAAVGGLVLTESKLTIPGTDDLQGGTPPAFQPPILTSIIGVDIAHAGMGPYIAGKIDAGRGFVGGDAESNYAVLSSRYAASNGLGVGQLITVSNTQFKVIGILDQSQDSNPADVYIPLARAQTLAQLTGYVNTIYVRAASAGQVDTVSREIAAFMPTATVTSSASLADQVSGSLSTVASLAETFGRWLSILALAAAVGAACLMTGAAVSRRARDFGTLKAIGWRNSRIIFQVVSESLVVGVVAALLGVAIGFSGTAVVARLAPDLNATVQEANSPGTADQPGANGSFFTGSVGGPMTTFANPNVTHTVTIDFNPQIGAAIVEAAVLLALGGGVIAGGAGGWRIARLRPSVALSRLD